MQFTTVMPFITDYFFINMSFVINYFFHPISYNCIYLKCTYCIANSNVLQLHIIIKTLINNYQN